jgi:hypothetical protein
LTAEDPFGADLARHARHLGGERAELIHHRVDGVLQFENLAFDVDGDLLRQVTGRDGRRDIGDVAHLSRQVRRHRVDALGQVLPRPRDAAHVGLPTENTFGADFSRDARHLGGERAELIHHRVDRVLQLEDFALDVDGDLLRQVAGRHGGRHFRDVAHLRRQVRRHRIDALGQILPRTRDALHVGLPAKTPFGADFARHARHLGGERR